MLTPVHRLPFWSATRGPSNICISTTIARSDFNHHNIHLHFRFAHQANTRLLSLFLSLSQTMVAKKSQKSNKAAKKGPNSNVEGDRFRQKNRIPEKIRKTIGDDRKVSILAGLYRVLRSQICVTVHELLCLMGGEHGGRRGPALHTGRPADLSSPEGARWGAEYRKSTGGGR